MNDQNTNQISENTEEVTKKQPKHDENKSANDNSDDFPQVDSEQKSKSVNKLFVAVGFCVALALLFACAVMFANKYREAQEAEKAEQQKQAVKKESASASISQGLAEEKAKARLQAQINAQAQAEKNTASEPIVVQNTDASTKNKYDVPTANSSAPTNYVTNTAPQNPQYNVVQPNTNSSNTTVNKQVDDIRTRKLSGNVIAYSASSNAMNNNQIQPNRVSTGFSPNSNEEPERNSFANQYNSTLFSATVAGQRKNLTMLLKQGTIIPCVLLTKIDSTYAGQTACQVARDIYSANGKTLLVERGSKIIGEQRIQVAQGQARVFVLWSQLETPRGVQVQLDSGSTDSLGASGIEARVNNHYLKRFGSAILISMIEDAISTLKDNGGQSGGVSYNSTSDSANEIAVEALKNSIGIPPTAHVHQGSLLNVFVSRDVDFQQVYKLVNRDF